MRIKIFAKLLKKKFLKYFEIIKISNGELFASPWNIVARILVQILRIGLFGIIYSYVYKASGKADINGFTAVNAIWSLALVSLIYQSSRNTFVLLKDEILSGQIETKLNKPYSFIVFSFLESFGQVPFKFLVFSSISVLFLGVVFGFPQFTLLQIVGMFVFYFFGVILYTLIQQLIGLTAFWIENPDPVYWIIGKLSWIVNGTFVPLALLPIGFRQIANVFPISAPFFIGRIFEIKDVGDLVKMALIQALWVFVAVLLIQYFYKKGITKVSINGG